MDARAREAADRVGGAAGAALNTVLDEATSDEAATRAAIAALYAVDWPTGGDIPLVDELTDDQRHVATALAFRRGIGGVLPEGVGLARFPIPLVARNRRQWLGMTPGVLEEVEAYDRNGQTVREPRWRRYRWLHPAGMAERGSVKEALGELDPVRRAQAYVELGLGGYMLYTQDPEIDSLFEAYGGALGAWAAQVAREVADAETPVRDDVKAALFRAVAAAGLPIDATVERCFVLDPYKPDRNLAFVRALAPERREEVLCEALAGGHGPSMVDAACTVLGEFPYAKAARIAGDRFAERIEQGAKGKQHPALVQQDQDRQERLRAVAAARPEIAEALRRALAVRVGSAKAS